MCDLVWRDDPEEVSRAGHAERVSSRGIKVRSDRHVNQHWPGLAKIHERLLRHCKPAVRQRAKIVLINIKSDLSFTSGFVHQARRVEVHGYIHRDGKILYFLE